jgi:hypothetical protein
MNQSPRCCYVECRRKAVPPPISSSTSEWYLCDAHRERVARAFGKEARFNTVERVGPDRLRVAPRPAGDWLTSTLWRIAVGTIVVLVMYGVVGLLMSLMFGIELPMPNDLYRALSGGGGR